MRFTLIVATKNRIEPLHTLFKSLERQIHRDFTVVVVDQNPPGMLDGLVLEYSASLTIRHLHSHAIGLSAARNEALAESVDDIVAFPDDDCFYDPWTLAHVDRLFSQVQGCDIILGKLLVPEKAAEAGPVQSLALNSSLESRRSVFHKAGSVVHFYRGEMVRKVGLFDSQLGVGALSPYGSGEDSDYLVRALDFGARIRRCPQVRIYHLAVDGRCKNISTKAFGYGRGRIWVIRKHRLGAWFMLLNIIHPILVMPWGGFGPARFRFHLLRGRWYEMRQGGMYSMTSHR